jgi:hypothetical protein
MAGMTSVPNSPAITLLATASTAQPSPALNAQYAACDPANGNYFVTTNRDLVTFICLPASAAPAYNGAQTYTVGQVVNSGGQAYIANANVPLATPPPAAQWTLYTGSTVTLLSAPDACTGRKADVVNYPVPDVVASRQAVEFLVLPSSVFTQANGQFQFQASSNLVLVYVRNL